MAKRDMIKIRDVLGLTEKFLDDDPDTYMDGLVSLLDWKLFNE